MTQRFILFFFLFMMAGGVFAQEIRVERSAEVVVLEGKSYYMHTVEAGQTLFSICKAYGVKVDEVLALNGKKDASLKPGEVLRIPKVEPFKRMDKKFYYHRMRPKETLYSLSREFGIKLKRILRDNPEYTESSIVPEGAVVRLSLRQIDERALKMALEWEEQMERGEGGRKDQPVEIPPARLDSVRLDTVRPVATEEETEPRRVKVAVLLPLNVESNKLPSMGIFEQDTAEVRASDERWRLDTKSDIFVQFYQGVLMAADSLKRDGYTLDLHVFDTRRDVAECGRLAGALNMLAPDLIVGPVFANEFRAVAEQLGDKTIPMIYPLSSRRDDLGRFPNMIQMNESEASLIEDMAEWVGTHAGAARLIQVSPESAFVKRWAGSDFVTLVRGYLPEGKRDSIVDLRWRAQMSLDSIRKSLDKNRENVILFPTVNEAAASRVLPVLSALADDYRLTLIGFPEWLRFTSVDDEVYFKLNTKMFANHHVDHESPEAEAFASRFRENFHEEPGTIANRAFDMVLYFIPLVDAERRALLQELPDRPGNGLFTRFRFQRAGEGMSLENRGLYMVNYRFDYTIVVAPVR